MPKKLTREEFIRRAKEVHGDRYDYSKVEYVNNLTNVSIICPIHGAFNQTPGNHLSGKGCKKCGYKTGWNTRGKKSLSEWVSSFREIHGNKYDYSRIEQIDKGTDTIAVVCRKCGNTFNLSATHHLRGDGCSFCNGGVRYSMDDFIKIARNKFGDKFTYLGEYVNNHTDITIVCPKHGVIKITPQHHLASDTGCQKCALESRANKRKLPISNIVKRLYKIHGDTVTLKESTYVDVTTPCTFVCSEHGDFISTPDRMLYKSKCPYCTKSHGEQRIWRYLVANKFNFKPQYKIDLGRLFVRSKLKIDFMVWIGNKKIAIEFNGLQHYEMRKFFHKTEQDFMLQKSRDRDLRKWCKQNHIKLIEIRYGQMNDIERILACKLK